MTKWIAGGLEGLPRIAISSNRDPAAASRDEQSSIVRLERWRDAAAGWLRSSSSWRMTRAGCARRNASGLERAPRDREPAGGLPGARSEGGRTGYAWRIGDRQAFALDGAPRAILRRHTEHRWRSDGP
jgi:hypothetical protein